MYKGRIDMNFTYLDYRHFIELLLDCSYVPTSYEQFHEYINPVILRHDIDYDIGKSLRLAEIEANQGVISTYFVLLTSDFYNVFSRQNSEKLNQIANLGHSIGLHFDEMNYPQLFGNKEQIIQAIMKEAEILQNALGIPIKTVSMHRPSREIIEANLQIPGMINSYSGVFFHDFKYLSDSRRRWREPVEEIVQSQKYDRLHILTHAFWYHDSEIDLKDTLNKFIYKARQERYETLSENFSNLNEALGGK